MLFSSWHTVPTLFSVARKHMCVYTKHSYLRRLYLGRWLCGSQLLARFAEDILRRNAEKAETFMSRQCVYGGRKMHIKMRTKPSLNTSLREYKSPGNFNPPMEHFWTAWSSLRGNLNAISTIRKPFFSGVRSL